jgi:hypothetical protein
VVMVMVVDMAVLVVTGVVVMGVVVIAHGDGSWVPVSGSYDGILEIARLCKLNEKYNSHQEILSVKII